MSRHHGVTVEVYIRPLRLMLLRNVHELSGWNRSTSHLVELWRHLTHGALIECVRVGEAIVSKLRRDRSQVEILFLLLRLRLK